MKPNTTFLPPPLLALLLPFLALAIASPQPPLVSAHDTFLIPRHTLFLRQATDLQTFNGALGGVAASPITNSGDSKRPFAVDGDTFPDFKSASGRSCDNQKNGCSEAANAQGNKGTTTVSDCDKQKDQCTAAQSSAKVQDFTTGVASTNIGPDPAFPDFDLICDA
ncbi:hypothetical protein K505DRAFT_324555 [Melanomma pulvis-pyrius CBS 109.77]|uniref:Uncharacterized protein n=1 Tax=Melanomma pulvis-pyrius CBS 109.77 TaxID=1314802 RepID=A0A6A6XEP3_9PLEO|nr:hypothetical protein K505DRAFT_324555 [Melanomma pulvis-pyrius CBS 109.77]